MLCVCVRCIYCADVPDFPGNVLVVCYDPCARNCNGKIYKQQAEAEDEEEVEAAAEAKQDRKQQQGSRGLAEEKAKKPRTDTA